MRSPTVTIIVMSIVAMWLGSALITSAVVAPAAFAVLPSRTLAGALVGRVLPTLFHSGIAVGLAIVLISRGTSLAGIVQGGVMIATCAIAQFVISPRIEAIRTAVGGPIDALGVADPRRIEFGRLHGGSVLLLGLSGLAALAALVIGARALINRIPA